MARICWRVGLLAIFASWVCSLQVKAAPITYIITTTATGTLGASAFTDASVTLTLSGDTSAVVPGPGQLSSFLVNPGASTVIIGGLGSAALTGSVEALSGFNQSQNGQGLVVIGQLDSPAVNPGSVTGILWTFSPAFIGYNLQTAIGPVSGSGSVANEGPADGFFPTTGGNLQFAAGQGDGAGSSTFTAVTTQNVTGLPGGPTSAPVYLVGGASIGEISGTIPPGNEDYYWFSWNGGAFSATASVTNATGASYIFSAGAAGTCNSVGNETLNSGDGFSGTISVGNLAAGQYCIGLDAAPATFSLTFNTPVSGVPEPGTFVLLSGGLAAIAIARRAARRRTR